MSEFASSEMQLHIGQAIEKLGPANLAALVQGPACTRLGPAQEIAQWLVKPATWDDLEDLRIFGAAGEWHAWNRGGGRWRDRLWIAKDESRRAVPRTFRLWGKDVTEAKAGWTKLAEANGAEVWVPDSSLPYPVLDAVEIVEFETDTGVAGIVDCALRSVSPNPHP
jgi:CRISPR-associated protein (TIGR03984 family)